MRQALNIRKRTGGPRLLTLVHAIFFATRRAGHLVGMAGN